MKLFDLDTALIAVTVAFKQVLGLLPALPVIGAAIGIGQITTELGAIGVACVAAIVGSLCRWYYFGLNRSDGLKGLVIAPAIATVLSDTKIPLFSFLFGDLSPESLPIINGFFVGMFGLLLVGFFVDFAREYSKKKAKE